MPMPKLDVQQQKIWDAAAALDAEGAKPTNDSVRRKMGGGTYSRISPVLRMWREHQSDIRLQQMQLPPEITAVLDTAGRSLMAVLQKQMEAARHAAEARVAKVAADADTRVREVEQEIASLEDENHELEIAHSEMSDSCKTAKEACAQLQTALNEARSRHVKELSDLAAKLAHSNDIQVQLREQLDAALRGNSDAAVDRAQLAGDLKLARQMLSQAVDARSTADNQIASLTQAASTAAQEIASLKESLQSRQMDLEKAQVSLSVAVENADAAKRDLQAAKTDAERHQNTSIRMQERASLLEETVQRLETRIAKLNSETSASSKKPNKATKESSPSGGKTR